MIHWRQLLLLLEVVVLVAEAMQHREHHTSVGASKTTKPDATAFKLRVGRQECAHTRRTECS